MKMKSLTLLVASTIILTLCSFNYQDKQSEKSYNIKRAIELIRENQLEEAESYLLTNAKKINA